MFLTVLVSCNRVFYCKLVYIASCGAFVKACSITFFNRLKKFLCMFALSTFLFDVRTAAGCQYGNRCRFVHSIVSEHGLVTSSSFAPLLGLASAVDSDIGLKHHQVDNECSGRNFLESHETVYDDSAVTYEQTSPHHEELGELLNKVQSCSLSENNVARKKKSGRKRNKKSAVKTGDRDSKGKELVLAKKHVMKCGERFFYHFFYNNLLSVI
jgi:hypothetical protein